MWGGVLLIVAGEVVEGDSGQLANPLVLSADHKFLLDDPLRLLEELDRLLVLHCVGSDVRYFR